MQSQWRQDFGLLRKDRSWVRSRPITKIPRQFAYPKVPTTTRFYSITYPRVKNDVNHKFLKLLCKLLVNLLKSSEIKRSIFFCKVTSGIAWNSSGDSVPYLTPISDLDRISHYNINKISSTQVMIIKNHRVESKENSGHWDLWSEGVSCS